MRALALGLALVMGAVIAQRPDPPGQAKRIGQSLVRELRAHGGRFTEARSRDGQSLGYVELPNGRIRWVRNGKLAELEPVEALPEADPLPVESVARVPPSEGGSGSSTVSVLVFYTPRAFSGSGGNIENEIALATNRMNQAFTNSRIDAETEVLASILLSDWVESGNSRTELSKFRLYPSLQPTLTAYGADCAMLMVQSMDGAGRAYYGPDKASCVGVTMRQYAVGNLTFAHEFGHTFGLGHNVGEYSYCGNGVGYEDPQKRFRTPMSYGTGPRTPQWAAPNALHYLLGVPVGTSQTDAAGCLRRTLPIVANFRQTVLNAPPAPPTAADAANVR